MFLLTNTDKWMININIDAIDIEDFNCNKNNWISKRCYGMPFPSRPTRYLYMRQCILFIVKIIIFKLDMTHISSLFICHVYSIDTLFPESLSLFFTWPSQKKLIYRPFCVLLNANRLKHFHAVKFNGSHSVWLPDWSLRHLLCLFCQYYVGVSRLPEIRYIYGYTGLQKFVSHENLVEFQIYYGNLKIKHLYVH